MKRAEAYVGQEVWVGGRSDVSTWRRAVVVGLDCGDNGYRVWCAVESRVGWHPAQWPLHSVHTYDDYRFAQASLEETALVAEIEKAKAQGVLMQMRADAAYISGTYGGMAVVVPDMRGGAHYARLDAAALRGIAGAHEA